MIVHHDQALVMSELAPERTNNKSIIDLAGRIEVSQEDEISFMEDWLFARDEQQSDNNRNHAYENGWYGNTTTIRCTGKFKR